MTPALPQSSRPHPDTLALTDLLRIAAQGVWPVPALLDRMIDRAEAAR